MNHADVWKYHQNLLRVFGHDISVEPGFTSTWQRRQNQGMYFLQEEKYTKVRLDGVKNMGEYLKSKLSCKPVMLSSCVIFRRVRLRLQKRQY